MAWLRKNLKERHPPWPRDLDPAGDCQSAAARCALVPRTQSAIKGRATPEKLFHAVRTTQYRRQFCSRHLGQRLGWRGTRRSRCREKLRLHFRRRRILLRERRTLLFRAVADLLAFPG